MRRTGSKSVGVVALFVLTLALVTANAAQAAPATFSCGQVITTSIKLTNDLVNCPVDGLVIGAANITIDLNGHRIDGTSGDGDPGDGRCYCGVADPHHRNGVTVANGRIQDFHDGVRTGGDDDTVRGLAVSHVFENGTNATFGHNYSVSDVGVDGAYRGVLLDDVRPGTVSGVRTSHISHSAIAVFSSDQVTVSGNTVDGRLTPSGSADWGIEIVTSTRTTVTRNTVDWVFDGVGIGVATIGHDIARNITISDNVVTRSGLGIGLATLVPGQSAPGKIDNVLISHNQVINNPEDGIGLLGPPDVPTAPTNVRIVDNTARGNGQNGIHVQAPGTAIGRNVANDNTLLGIDSVPDVQDLGGNRAAHNGDPRQCVGVVCS